MLSVIVVTQALCALYSPFHSFCPMDTSFSNRLFLLPLFQGFSRLDFLDIVEKTPFFFKTLQPGAVLFRQGDTCESLCLVLRGEIETDVKSLDDTYHFKEYFAAPWVVQPERLFGYHNLYACTVRAQTETQIVMLDKQSMRNLLMRYPVFQINFYNMISTAAQNAIRQLWMIRSHTLPERFKHFLQLRSMSPVGRKELLIRMDDLAQELGTTRLRVSQMLAELSRQGLLTYSRGAIHIPALEKM